MYFSVMTTEHRFVQMDNCQLQGKAETLLTRESYIEVYEEDEIIGSMSYLTVDISTALANNIDISKFKTENKRLNRIISLMKEYDENDRIQGWEDAYRYIKHLCPVVAVYINMIYAEPEHSDVKFDLIKHIPSYIKLTDNADVKDIIIAGQAVEYIDNIPVESTDERVNNAYRKLLAFMDFEDIGEGLFHKTNCHSPNIKYV